MIMKNGRILLKLNDSKELKKDGIVYTDDQKHKSFEGVVVETGSDEYDIGNTVIFSEYSGEEVWIRGEKFTIIDEENIWGIIE